MSLDVYLDPNIVAGSPVLDAGHLASLESRLGQPLRRIDFTFDVAGGKQQRAQPCNACARIFRRRRPQRRRRHERPAVIVLTDRGATEQRAALPALLALSTAWKEMVRDGAHDMPLIVETGQVIETHHIAMLIAVGASAVFPYLAMRALRRSETGRRGVSYRVAVEAGLRKVLARMGISTVASYRNSHLFEAVGLDEEICEEFFEDASASLGRQDT